MLELQTEDRIYVVAATLALNREASSVTDEQFLKREIPPMVAFVEEDPSHMGREYRLQLLEAIASQRPKSKATSLTILAKIVLDLQNPKSVEKAEATAVSDTPSKPFATVKKTSKKGATRKKTAG